MKKAKFVGSHSHVYHEGGKYHKYSGRMTKGGEKEVMGQARKSGGEKATHENAKTKNKLFRPNR